MRVLASQGQRPYDGRVESVTLHLTYTTRILIPLEGSVRIWIPLPESDHAQEIKDPSVHSPLPYRIGREKTFGNRMISIEGRSVGKSEIQMAFTIKRKQEKDTVDRALLAERFLEPAEWEVWNDEIARFADGLLGRERDPIVMARKLFYTIVDMMEFAEGVCGLGVSTLAFRQRVGRSDEFHALFRSILLYRGVPVIWEEGIMLPYPSSLKGSDTFEVNCLKTLSWVRFYGGEGRWIPVDLAEAKRRPDLKDLYFGKIPPNRIRMSRGRGMDLVPKQNLPINTFPYTYMEIDGNPAIYGHHYRNVLTYRVMDLEGPQEVSL